MNSSKNTQATPGSAKRRSGQLDFSSIGPLKAGGTVGFSAFRDKDTQKKSKTRKKSNGNIAEDSDDDDDDDDGIQFKMDDADDKIDDKKLGPEDAQSSGELADGVNRIRVGAYQKKTAQEHRYLHSNSLRELTRLSRVVTLPLRRRPTPRQHRSTPPSSRHQRATRRQSSCPRAYRTRLSWAARPRSSGQASTLVRVGWGTSTSSRRRRT